MVYDFFSKIKLIFNTNPITSLQINNTALEILVVEDNPKHLEDAKKFYGTIPQYKILFDYSSYYEEALKKLKRKPYDGILTDLFIPIKPGQVTSDLGIQLGQYALDREIPVVICTNTFHHEDKTQPATDWIRSKEGNLIDGEFIGSSILTNEAETKDFEGALAYLVGLIELQKTGEIIVNSHGYHDSRKNRDFLDFNPGKCYDIGYRISRFRKNHSEDLISLKENLLLIAGKNRENVLNAIIHRCYMK